MAARLGSQQCKEQLSTAERGIGSGLATVLNATRRPLKIGTLNSRKCRPTKHDGTR